MFSALRASSLEMLFFLRTLAIFLLISVAAASTADAPATSRPEDILGFLNQTVVWYRLLSNQQQLVNEPSDAVFLSDNRQIAEQVVRLSFEFARIESQQLSSQGTGNATDTQNPSSSSQYQNLVNLAEKSKQRISDQEKQLESLKKQLASTRGKQRVVLESEIAESEDELELLKARNETIQNILQFASGVSTSSGTKGLQAQIEELARTVPAAAIPGKQPAAPESTASQPPASTPVSAATAADQ